MKFHKRGWNSLESRSREIRETKQSETIHKIYFAPGFKNNKSSKDILGDNLGFGIWAIY